MQSRDKSHNKRKIRHVSDHPLPKESERVVEVNFRQGKSTLRIMVRNDDLPKSARMIKSKVESNKGEWFLNKYCKGKKVEEQSTQLTKT